LSSGIEGEGRIDVRVHHLEVETEVVGDRPPVAHTRTAHGIDADPETRGPDRLHVDDLVQSLHVGRNEIVAMCGVGAQCRVQGLTLHGGQTRLEQLIGALLDAVGDVAVRRTAVGRVVLEAAVFGGVVGGRDDDPVRQLRGAPAVVGQDRVRHGRGRGVTARRIDGHLRTVGTQHLERAGKRGL
jgi:hypothetical protein